MRAAGAHLPLALGCLLLTAPAPASAEPLGQGPLAKVTARAYGRWRTALQAEGLSGLQAEVATCFAAVKARPSQAQAAYCAALDHYCLLDALNFPADLRPPYFATDAVFARLDAAVAQSTPAKDRFEFTRRFLVTADETIRAGRR